MPFAIFCLQGLEILIPVTIIFSLFVDILISYPIENSHAIPAWEQIWLFDISLVSSAPTKAHKPHGPDSMGQSAQRKSLTIRRKAQVVRPKTRKPHLF
jgi:hypothetical protein